MSKILKPAKKTVELQPEARPSRRMRDPVRVAEPEGLDKVPWRTPEWEIRLAIIGIILFALAINTLTIGISAITGD